LKSSERGKGKPSHTITLEELELGLRSHFASPQIPTTSIHTFYLLYEPQEPPFLPLCRLFPTYKLTSPESSPNHLTTFFTEDPVKQKGLMWLTGMSIVSHNSSPEKIYSDVQVLFQNYSKLGLLQG
jgi:hypothetical protein